jgi:hypothetical protein
MPKATMSFEQSRKALLTRMTEKSTRQVVQHEIGFNNEDVPQFLETLEKFQKESKKHHFVVK